MEGETEPTRGLRRSCPRSLPPAPGWRSSDQAGVAASASLRANASGSQAPVQAFKSLGRAEDEFARAEPEQAPPCKTPGPKPKSLKSLVLGEILHIDSGQIAGH
jgi:hypothetical protein